MSVSTLPAHQKDLGLDIMLKLGAVPAAGSAACRTADIVIVADPTKRAFPRIRSDIPINRPD
jgi:hypothetical protein